MISREKRFQALLLVLLLMILSLNSLIYLDQPRSEEPATHQTFADDQHFTPSVFYRTLDGQCDTQCSNGSWDEDVETTVLTSNMLSQQIEVVEEENALNGMDPESNETMIETNQAIQLANDWAMDNYDPSFSTKSQAVISYSIQTNSRSAPLYPEMMNLSDRANDIIEARQDYGGSWENDVEQTSFALLALKESPSRDEPVITTGEQWLASKSFEGHFGNSYDDTVALLALGDSDHDTSATLEFVISTQRVNGSFGDIETTVWTVIALSKCDTPKSKEAARGAMKWLKDQDGASPRELGLINLAGLEYSTISFKDEHTSIDIDGEKGPPGYVIILLMITGGFVLGLILIYNRVSLKNVLDGTRKNIYEHILDHPGINQNALMRDLSLSSSSVRHHLGILKKYDYIVVYNDGRYLRYYPAKKGSVAFTNGHGNKEAISVLRRSNSASIVTFIKDNPQTTQSYIAEALNLHPSTVHWYTKQLLATRIIHSKRMGKTIQYWINDPLAIDDLLTLAS